VDVVRTSMDHKCARVPAHSDDCATPGVGPSVDGIDSPVCKPDAAPRHSERERTDRKLRSIQI
jgi:hypothetical protein